MDHITLYTWVRLVVKIHIKENKISEILNKGKKKWYLFAKNEENTNNEIEITDEYLQNIEKYIEEQLENQQKQTIQREKDCIYFSTSIMLRGGSIHLSK